MKTIRWLILTVTAIYSENHKKPTDTSHAQNAELLDVKQSHYRINQSYLKATYFGSRLFTGPDDEKVVIHDEPIHNSDTVSIRDK
jgi:hypothetical protein